MKPKIHRCNLCNRTITSEQKYFQLGLCAICYVDLPAHIPSTQKRKYLVKKILKRKGEIFEKS